MDYHVLSGADDGTPYHVVFSGSPRSAHSGAAEICCVYCCEEGGEGGNTNPSTACEEGGERGDTNPSTAGKEGGEEDARTSCWYACGCANANPDDNSS